MSVCDVPVISAVCDTVGQGAATLIAAPFDWLAQAMGGVVSTTGPGPDRPMRAGSLVGDLVPGLMAALGLVSALAAEAILRARTDDATIREVMMLASLELWLRSLDP